MRGKGDFGLRNRNRLERDWVLLGGPPARKPRASSGKTRRDGTFASWGGGAIILRLRKKLWRRCSGARVEEEEDTSAGPAGMRFLALREGREGVGLEEAGLHAGAKKKVLATGFTTVTAGIEGGGISNRRGGGD